MKKLTKLKKLGGRKKVVVVKDKDEEVDKAKKNWVDGKILHLIALRGKMELKFVQNAKSKVNFVFVLEIYFQL